MKRIISWVFLVIVSSSFVWTGCQGEETVVSPPLPVTVQEDKELLYLDATALTSSRIEDLLARMTLAEKIGQMTLVEKNSINPEDVTANDIGAVLSGGGGSPSKNSPEAWVEMVGGYQEAALQSRLGIPLLYGVDAVHGHNNVKGAAIFPHNIGLGATQNPELLEQIGRATAVEVTATGIDWNYAPAVTVPQDIRWGRTYEGYSEDTELVSVLGAAYLEGLQGGDLSDPQTVLATPKHFVGDGGTTWGSSNTGDYQIDQGDTQIDEATLRAVHLPPYQAAIEAGAQSIMVSFSSWNGTKMHAQQYLLTAVLKGELGFAGFLVSDWEAVDQINPNDYYDSVVTAINAGIDMNMVPHNYERFVSTLTHAVEKGDVSQERIDDAVRRILTVKFALGLFERPLPNPDHLTQVGTDAHLDLAREAVRQSLVLLKNDDDTLPLSKETPLIFVGGEAADDIGIQSGGWTIEWQGKAGNITPGTTILEGIEAAVSEDTNVRFNRIGRFERITDAGDNPAIADVGIAVVGERPYAEGVGDNADLILADGELAVIDRLRESSERLVIILISGRPLIINEPLETADAFVAAWLPGTEGAGVADLLFGEALFSGKLPYTWPRDIIQLPAAGIEDPLFPLGFGLETQTEDK
ncbi:MAG: beta-glucosidase [Chloroflexi bacterium]|jgi:beta-glucosidase|nr:beta-glucosidase [Chloroflexota bacterium]